MDEPSYTAHHQRLRQYGEQYNNTLRTKRGILSWISPSNTLRLSSLPFWKTCATEKCGRQENGLTIPFCSPRLERSIPPVQSGIGSLENRQTARCFKSHE
jgi:hypothetical protein